MKHRQVVVAEFPNEIDAEIAKGHLASEGIESSIVRNNVGGMFPASQYTEGVQVVVAENQEERARRILKARHG